MKEFNLLKDIITVVVCLAFAYVVGMNTLHEGEIYKVFLGQVTYVTYAHRVENGIFYMFNTLCLLIPLYFMGRNIWRD